MINTFPEFSMQLLFPISSLRHAACLAAWMVASAAHAAAGAPQAAAQAPVHESTAAGWSQTAAPESTPATYLLSRDHVNLVRVTDDRITDAVFDAEALEVSADKERGIVFVRVRRSWAEKTAIDVTSAYFNTRTENHSVRFVVAAVPSQTIDLPASPKAADETAAGVAARLEALEKPLVRFTDSDYVAELKELTAAAASGRVKPEAAAVGRAFASGSGERFVELAVDDAPFVYEGLRVRMKSAFLTRDKLVETFVATNVSPKRARVDLAAFARDMAGVLAVAAEKTELSAAEQTEVVVIRARRLAQTDAAGLAGTPLAAAGRRQEK